MLNCACFVLVILNTLLVLINADHFECYPNRTIHVHNPDIGIYTYHRAFYDDGGIINCTVTSHSSHSDVYIHCASTTATVTAYFSDRPFSTDDIVGGNAISYTFVCASVTSYIRNIEDDLNIGVNQTDISVTPEYDLEAGFYDNSGNEVTSASVGDSVMFVIKGPAEYLLLPKSCTALGTNSESAILTTNGCTNDSSLISDFSHSTTGLYNHYLATFYVFKFYNSDTVTLECLVKVCADSGDCSSNACVNRRKRRSITASTDVKQDTVRMSTVGRRLLIIERALGTSSNIYGSAIVSTLMLMLTVITGY